MRLLVAALLVSLGACGSSEPTELEKAEQIEAAWNLIPASSLKERCEEGPEVYRAYRMAGDEAKSEVIRKRVEAFCAGDRDREAMIGRFNDANREAGEALESFGR